MLSFNSNFLQLWFFFHQILCLPFRYRGSPTFLSILICTDKVFLRTSINNSEFPIRIAIAAINEKRAILRGFTFSDRCGKFGSTGTSFSAFNVESTVQCIVCFSKVYHVSVRNERRNMLWHIYST